MSKPTPGSREFTARGGRRESFLPMFLAIVILTLALLAVLTIVTGPIRDWAFAPFFAFIAAALGFSTWWMGDYGWSKSAIYVARVGTIVGTLYLGGLVIAQVPAVLLRSRPDANEGALWGAMRVISTAQASYQAAGLTMAHGIGQYTDLATLANPGQGGAPFIDDVLGSGVKHGYSFAVTVTIGNPPAYTCTATPIGKAGVRSFFVDQTGVIRYTWDGTVATAESDPAQ